MIKIDNVSIIYGKNEVVKNFSLEIKDGEFYTILGNSGSGKTTILRGIAGLEKISRGNIWFDNKNITNMDIEKRNIGFIFQNYTLFPNMSVHDNIAFGLKEKKEKIDEIVKEIAKVMKIDSILYKMPHELSGGQQQRVAIARSLVLKPKILLLDEPFSNLDKRLKEQLTAEVYKLNRETKTTILYVTHDQNESFGYSDKIVIMKDGKIQQVDTPVNIYNKPLNDYVAEFFGKNKLEDKFIKRLKLNLDINKHYYIKKEDIKLKNSNKKYQKGKVIFEIIKAIYNGFYYEYELQNTIQKLRVIDFDTEKKYSQYVEVNIDPKLLIEVDNGRYIVQ